MGEAMTEAPVLGMVVPDLYHASTTFFHEHIAGIAPGRTVVVHLSSTGRPALTDTSTVEVPIRAPFRRR